MKNIKRSIVFMLGLCMSLFFVTSVKANNHLPLPVKTFDKLETDNANAALEIEIILSRKRKNCEDKGICKIIIRVGKIAQPRTGYGNSAFSDGHFVVDFEKSQMDDKTLSEFFGSGNFEMGEDFTLTSDLTSAYGYKGDYNIPAGSYAVEDLGSVLRVVF